MPVEPERELVQVVVQVRPRHRALMRPQQPSFKSDTTRVQERHHAMHPRQQLGRGLSSVDTQNRQLIDTSKPTIN
jgi:hypothetical protein